MQLGLLAEAQNVAIVEGENEQWFTVNLDEQACSCGDASCTHRLVAAEVLENGGRAGLKWESISAMHKEIRRGCYEQALDWMSLAVEFDSEYRVKDYLRKIAAEEFQNLQLLHEVERIGSLDPDEMLLLLCRHKKRWAVAGGLEPKRRWNMAVTAHGEPSPAEIVDALEHVDVDDPDALARLFWGAWAHKIEDEDYEPLKAWRTAMANAGLAARTLTEDDVELFRRRLGRKHEDEDELLWMIVTGMLPNDPERFVECVPKRTGPENPDGRLVIRRVPRYALDHHVVRGKNMLAAWQKKNGGAEPWYEMDLRPMDWRWAGGDMGMMWRYLACAKHGEAWMHSHWWHELKLTEAEKAELAAMDI